MKNIIIIIFLILFIKSLNAQNGTIRGRITDGNNGEALIGANIILLNTSPLIGTITDFDGNFSITKIPDENYNIKISFISYESKIVEDVEIANNKVTVLDLQLSQSSEEISEIVISANSLKNSEQAIQTIQRKSANLVNGISSQQISRLGDSDAASALKRVSGVSVDGGKYIYVRGLSDRYSKITLNGAEIPGLDPNKNTVQMDIFPTNIIDNIIVYKTFAPDLPGSFSGGYVDITTKDFPEKLSIQFSNSFSYNKNANLRDDFLSYQGSKTDWLGYDNGYRDVPEIAKNGIPWLYENNNLLDQITASFNSEMQVKTKKSFLNQSNSLAIGNQINVLKRSLGINASLSYSHDYAMYQNGEYARYYLVATNSDDGIMNMNINQTDNKSDEEIVLSALLNLSYKISNSHKISFNILRNQAGTTSARYKYGNNQKDNIYMYENTLAYLERSFVSYQLRGKHVFENFNNFQIDWLSSLTNSKMDEPDLRFFNFDGSDGNYQISYNAYPSPSRFYRQMQESNFDNKINFTYPFKMSHILGKIKFGGAYIYKERNSESQKFDIMSQKLEFNGDISEYLKPENIGQNATDATYGLYVQNDPVVDKANGYNATENINATYMMADLTLNKNLRIVTGVRYEYDNIFVENNIEKQNNKYVSANHVYDADILPAINITYSIRENTNIRFALSKTVARPSFREIAPYAFYDFKEGWRIVGNPELKRSQIDNIDFRWEKFFKAGEMVSFSVFYKKFTNPIELVDEPRASNPEFHYVNIENSTLYGAELELRKQIATGLNIGTNITYIESKVLESQENYEVGLLINPDFERSRPMYGQAPWVINSHISYDNKKYGIATNMGFNVSGEKLVLVTKGGTPNVYEKAFPSLNFNISKIFAKKISVKFAISNLLDANVQRVYTYQNKEYIFQSYKMGRNFALAINYSF